MLRRILSLVLNSDNIEEPEVQEYSNFSSDWSDQTGDWNDYYLGLSASLEKYKKAKVFDDYIFQDYEED